MRPIEDQLTTIRERDAFTPPANPAEHDRRWLLNVVRQALPLLDRWQDGWSDESAFPLLNETRALLAAVIPKDGTP